MHGVSPVISGGVLLGNGTTASVGEADDVYQSSYVFSRTLAVLYAPQQQTNGYVRAHIQGKQYLSQTQNVAKQDAVGIAAVLRTPNAWVDHVKVRVAYQLKDVYGSPVVNRPSSVTMELGALSSSSLVQF